MCTELACRHQLLCSRRDLHHFERLGIALRSRHHLRHDLPELTGGALPEMQQVTSAAAACELDVARDKLTQLAQRLRVGHLITLRDGKVARFEVIPDQREALAAAGIGPGGGA